VIRCVGDADQQVAFVLGPVEVVGVDGVRRLAVACELVLWREAATSGEKLPLELRGKGHSPRSGGPVKRVCVSTGGGERVARQRGQVGELFQAFLENRGGRRDLEDADAVAVHAHRKVDVVSPA